MEQMVDLEGAADLLGVSVTSLRGKVRRGTFVLPCDDNPENGPWYLVSDIEAYQAKHRKKTK